MFKKLMGVFLSTALVSSMLVGLTMPTTAYAMDENTQALSLTQEETRSFTDSLGRTVEIPKNLNHVAPFGVLGQIIMWPLAADEFVGLSRPLTNLETKYIDSKYAALPNVGQYFGKNNLNVAEIKKLNPQVVIDVGESKKGMASQLDNIQAQLGIPVIHIEASIDTMPQAYRTLGKLFNKQAKAEELATYCEKVLENTDSIIMQAEMFGKKSLVYCLGNDGLNVLAQGTFHTEIIDKLADNLAVVPNPSSKGTGNPIKMTDLQGWNPEVILFGPDSIYSTVGTNAEWQNLQAIQNKTYYEVPNGPYNWLGMPPSVNRYMGMIWLSSILYPEISSYNMYQETKDYYNLFYNCNLTPEMYDELTQNSLIK